MPTDRNITGGVSENTSVNESYELYGDDPIKPISTEQLREKQIRQAHVDLELFRAALLGLAEELNEYLENCELAKLEPAKVVTDDLWRRIEMNKARIARTEAVLASFGIEVAA